MDIQLRIGLLNSDDQFGISFVIEVYVLSIPKAFVEWMEGPSVFPNRSDDLPHNRRVVLLDGLHTLLCLKYGVIHLHKRSLVLGNHPMKRHGSSVMASSTAESAVRHFPYGIGLIETVRVLTSLDSD
ncbi:hypothetical protein OUZ56_032780 [Daphnia magna]|uniref:Uncharacterized protein n=1 Tax=Daphnia magna TaxID=35525 RepID=A0ABQ9ZY24_9CRUS|nr:hypothetical protein OUZ56_032780 [Daphnia magna]